MSISGTAGNDTLVGTIGDDVIEAQGGNDTIAATGGMDHNYGGDGFDQLRFITADAARFVQPWESRTITVTNDWVGASDGTINSYYYDIESLFIRTIGTGDFGDTINGSASSASLVLRLGDGNDTVVGSAHDDNITTGLGINSIDAGAGNDFVYAQYDNSGGATAYVTMVDGAVVTTVDGVAVNSVANAEYIGVQGMSLDAAVTTVDASGLTGFSGQLIFWDHNGSNISIGSVGGDVFANVHGGEAGNDVYSGNGGADIYDYTWAVGAMDRDTITDFDTDDIIDFQYNNATYNSGGLLADQFIGAANFTGVAGQYRYYASGGQTFVQADTNGDGVADETLTIANGQFALGETAPGSNILQMIGTSGTSGNDFFVGTLGDDTYYAQGGNDTIAATGGMDHNYGGDGFDQLRFITADAARFVQPWESRTITVTNDWVGASDGTINSYYYDIESLFIRTIGTGDFGDTINGSASSASLVLRLGDGNDTVVGSAHDDNITTGLGINSIDAGAGNDFVYAQYDNSGGATAYVTMVDGAVVTTVDGVAVNSVANAEYIGVQGMSLDAAVTTVDASGLTGFSGQLIFWDHNGSNISIGSVGGDVFANVHGGEAGNDVYSGNGGADIYDYTWAVGAMDRDTITDFDTDDIIDFQYNNATYNSGGLLADQFIGAANFTGVAGQYRYYASGGQTFVQADTNGDGVADETLTIANGQFALGETAPGSNILQMIGTSGTSGADTLTGTLGDDSIYAQAGNDMIHVSQGTDYIDGGAGGGDRLIVTTGNATLFTAATGARTYVLGANSLTDSSGTINTSFTGIERVLLSTVGNGDYDDVIDASGFSSAHQSALTVQLGNGDNQYIGSTTNDRLFTGFGSNIADGGAGGYDFGSINVDASGDVTITITNVGGTLVTSANGVVNQFTSFDEVWVQGVGAGAVTLDASAYTDISGLLLVLVGHNGSDIMIGSAGNDYFANITGQVLGTDVYTGNGGFDIYDYTWAADSMNGDTITDFDTDDVIDLRFNSLNPGGSPVRADHFIGADQFTGVAGEYRYQINGAQTVVQVDSDGDKIVDQTLTISNGAFILSETFAGSNILTMATAIDTLEGVVADGYLAGATLFIDTNGNLTFDDGEASTVTDADGNFTLNVNYDGTLVAFGGTNIDTGLANTMTLAAPDGSGVVNPLTTLVQAVIDAGNGATSAAEAEDQVLAALGLDPDLDLFNLDLIAAAATDPAALEAQKAAAMIANLVATAEEADGAVTDTETLLVDALAGLVTGGGGVIDLTDAATLTPLLTEALPNVDVGDIADEAAFEGAAIAAADSIDEISDAQIDADAFNHIAGGAVNDTLTGGTDRDRIVGGDGKDFLRGGGGDDVFVAEITPTKSATKAGSMSVDVIFDFNAGDKIDVSGLDANWLTADDQAFSWKGTNANKFAGDLSYKSYTSVQGAEKALGIDIDGVAGPSPYSGPVTIVYGNVDGGNPDFAMVLIGVGSVTQSDFIFA